MTKSLAMRSQYVSTAFAITKRNYFTTLMCLLIFTTDAALQWALHSQIWKQWRFMLYKMAANVQFE